MIIIKNSYLSYNCLKKALIIVTYWPSTQPSIEKQVHPVEDITLTCGQVEFSADTTPTRCRCTSNNYMNRVPQTLRVGWSQLVGVRVAVRASENQLPAVGLDPQDPRLSNPTEWERSVAKDRGTWGQYVAVCSFSNSPLTHNPFATLSRIKCERYIFLKKSVRLSLLLTMFPCIAVYVLCGYTTSLAIENI